MSSASMHYIPGDPTFQIARRNILVLGPARAHDKDFEHPATFQIGEQLETRLPLGPVVDVRANQTDEDCAT